jgi:hypothetical protein
MANSISAAQSAFKFSESHSNVEAPAGITFVSAASPSGFYLKTSNRMEPQVVHLDAIFYLQHLFSFQILFFLKI